MSVLTAQSMFRKAVSTLEGVKSGEYSRRGEAEVRCRFQLPIALQHCSRDLHVAYELYTQSKMVSRAREL